MPQLKWKIEEVGKNWKKIGFFFFFGKSYSENGHHGSFFYIDFNRQAGRQAGMVAIAIGF